MFQIRQRALVATAAAAAGALAAADNSQAALLTNVSGPVANLTGTTPAINNNLLTNPWSYAASQDWNMGRDAYRLIDTSSAVKQNFIGNGETVTGIDFVYAWSRNMNPGRAAQVQAYLVTDPANVNSTTDLSRYQSVLLTGDASEDLLMDGGAQAYRFQSTNLFPASFKADAGQEAAVVLVPLDNGLKMFSVERDEFMTYATQPAQYMNSSGSYQLAFSGYNSDAAIGMSTVPEPSVIMGALGLATIMLGRRFRMK